MQSAIVEGFPWADVCLSVVWINMLGADSEEAARRAANLVQDPRVRHFYDADRRAGRAIAGVLGAQDKVAWDVYLFYAAGEVWDECPPVPTDWVHQLSGALWADSARRRYGPRLAGSLQALMHRYSHSQVSGMAGRTSARRGGPEQEQMDQDGGGAMKPTPAEHWLEVAVATITAAEYCFLTTLARSGPPQARLMMPFDPEEDLTIWMAASPGSRKVCEIRADGRATLAYAHPPAGAYFTLLGTATIETDLDLRRHYWRRRAVQFWPEGPEGDDYVLIRFVPSRIELMNVEMGIVPEPYGLRCGVLVRDRDTWLVAHGE